MVFEVGKYYRHTLGSYLAIRCEIETTNYGKCLCAEFAGRRGYGLMAVGKTEQDTVNFEEVTKEEWMENFKEC